MSNVFLEHVSRDKREKGVLWKGKEEKVHHDEEELATHYQEQELRKPYVVLEDIHILLKDWAKKRFVLPSNEFFSRLRKEMEKHLSRIFGAGNVDMVSADELIREIEKFLLKIGLPAVSMEGVYLKTELEIQITRLVDGSLIDCGVGPRFGAPPLKKQYFAVAEKYKNKEIVLVDDALFSGESVITTIRNLETRGVRVPIVIIGITIGENTKRIREETDTEVLAIRHYDKVIDVVCERDFYPGVPLCGRSIANMPIDCDAPYMHPFDINSKGETMLEKWASIPKEKQMEFSIFCLRQSIRLWEEIEKLSKRTIKCRDLWRIPFGFHRSYYSNNRFVDCLKDSLNRLL